VDTLWCRVSGGGVRRSLTAAAGEASAPPKSPRGGGAGTSSGSLPKPAETAPAAAASDAKGTKPVVPPVRHVLLVSVWVDVVFAEWLLLNSWLCSTHAERLLVRAFVCDPLVS
jgi:hypothetical protein